MIEKKKWPRLPQTQHGNQGGRPQGSYERPACTYSPTRTRPCPPPVRRFVGITYCGHPSLVVSHTHAAPHVLQVLCSFLTERRFGCLSRPPVAEHLTPKVMNRVLCTVLPPVRHVPPLLPPPDLRTRHVAGKGSHGSTLPALDQQATTDTPTSSGPPQDALSLSHGHTSPLVFAHSLCSLRSLSCHVLLHILQHPSLPDRYYVLPLPTVFAGPPPSRAPRSFRRAWKCANCTLRAWRSALASHQRFDHEDLSLLPR